MRTTVLGCGRWGSFLSWYSATGGRDTVIWGRKGSKRPAELSASGRNEYLELPAGVAVTDSLEDALRHGEIILIAISAQELRSLARTLNDCATGGKTFVLCMKGLEADTGKRLSQVFREEVGARVDLAVWLGPGHVQEFLRGTPNCMVIGSENIDVTKRIVDEFGGKLIRFYYGQDMIGSEVGAASKNVMGVAAGMLDGLGISSLKSALMARGAREISRLVRAMGGNELTVYGLCHLGDYEATLFSPLSHNRRFGEMLVRCEKFVKLAEGVPTLQALRILSELHDVELPISDAVHSIVLESQSPREALGELFMRPAKFEF